MKRPPQTNKNIVVIQAESLDGRALGCMGEPGATTPNIDKLAARGTTFIHAYCNSPQCVPSRSSMWSGRYVHQVGAYNNFRGLPQSQRTFIQDLEAADYTCSVQGRTDHRMGFHNLKGRLATWTRPLPEPVYVRHRPKHSLNEKGKRQRDIDWEILDNTQDWLRTRSATSQPFFLYMGLHNTHPGAGYNTSTYWLDKIDEAQATMPDAWEETHPVMQYMIKSKGCGGGFDEDFIRTCRLHYLAMIAETDGIVGELMETLEEEDLLEDTVVIFTADHGDMRFEHGQFLKNAHYEASARIPFIMAGPGIQMGRRVEQPVSLIDVYPTLMELSNATPPENPEGHSLLPLATGNDSDHPGAVFSEYHSNFQQTGSFMLRKGHWKYILYPGFESQLFNLADDPAENRNLVNDKPEVAAALDAEMRQLLDPEAVDRTVKAHDIAEFNAWRLGYPGDSWLEKISQETGCNDPHLLSQLKTWANANEPAE